MIKNSKKRAMVEESSTVASTRYSPMELPDIANMDDLAVMHDDGLYARARGLDSDRRTAISVGMSPYDWEVEMAYVCRELQLRHDRHNRHLEYVVELQKAGGEVDWSVEKEV